MLWKIYSIDDWKNYIIFINIWIGETIFTVSLSNKCKGHTFEWKAGRNRRKYTCSCTEENLIIMSIWMWSKDTVPQKKRGIGRCTRKKPFIMKRYLFRKSRERIKTLLKKDREKCLYYRKNQKWSTAPFIDSAINPRPVMGNR